MKIVWNQAESKFIKTNLVKTNDRQRQPEQGRITLTPTKFGHPMEMRHKVGIRAKVKVKFAKAKFLLRQWSWDHLNNRDTKHSLQIRPPHGSALQELWKKSKLRQNSLWQKILFRFWSLQDNLNAIDATHQPQIRLQQGWWGNKSSKIFQGPILLKQRPPKGKIVQQWW